MLFDDAVRGRRSIRRFADRPVGDDVIRAILDLARHAPSSLDGQPWCFVVVRAAETKRRIAEAKNRFSPSDKRGYPADFLATAPAIVAVCFEQARAHERGRESALLATATILLAAHRFGLGSTFLAAYQPKGSELRDAICDILGLPAGIEPVSLLPLGYPGEVPRDKTLRPLAAQVHDERYGELPRAD